MDANRSTEEPSTVLKVTALVDPVVEAHGFDPQSVYVEFCFLPVLGPTATFAYRRFGSVVAGRPGGERMAFDLVDLSRSLGLGEGTGRNSIIVRAIGRLVQFGVAEWQGDVLAVRRALAPLPARHVARLGYTARAMHQRITEQRPRSGD